MEGNRLTRRRRKLWGIATCIALTLNMYVLSAFASATSAFADDTNSLGLAVEAAILIEAETGQVLYEFNADEPRQPASMAKMMTEFVVMEQIKSGKIQWTSEVNVTGYASNVGGSGQLLAEGETYTVKDLFRNMSIYSGNDASVALAEFVAGSESKFVDLMNEMAQTLGLKSAHFVNATGLNKEDYPQQFADQIPPHPGETVISARDVAELARNIVTKHPEVLEYSSTPTSNQREGDPNSPLMTNWNWMLEGWKSYNNNFSSYAYDGLDGLKTGHTDEAGYCFTGTAERNGMRLISVVMGAESEPQRFEQTRKLLDYGFNNFEKKTVLAGKTTLEQMPTIEVKKAKDTDVPVVTEVGVNLVVGKTDDESALQITAEPLPEEQRVAPVKQGEALGTAKIVYDNGTIQIEKTINLVAAEDVDKAGWFRLLMRAIRNFFADLFGGIKDLF